MVEKEVMKDRKGETKMNPSSVQKIQKQEKGRKLETSSRSSKKDITKELEMYEKKQMNKMNIKETIATLCTAILENPEKMVSFFYFLFYFFFR